MTSETLPKNINMLSGCHLLCKANLLRFNISKTVLHLLARETTLSHDDMFCQITSKFLFISFRVWVPSVSSLFFLLHPKFLHSKILPPRIAICNYMMHFPPSDFDWSLSSAYSESCNDWVQLSGRHWCLLYPIYTRETPVWPNWELAIDCKVTLVQPYLHYPSLDWRGLCCLAKPLCLPQKKSFFFSLSLFQLFFKVDFSSTGAWLGWESETELHVAGGLGWELGVKKSEKQVASLHFAPTW